MAIFGGVSCWLVFEVLGPEAIMDPVFCPQRFIYKVFRVGLMEVKKYSYTHIRVFLFFLNLIYSNIELIELLFGSSNFANMVSYSFSHQFNSYCFYYIVAIYPLM